MDRIFQNQNGKPVEIFPGKPCDCLDQLQNPDSAMSQKIKDKLDTAIQEKVESGELGGANLVTAPALTLNGNAIIGQEVSITATAQSELDNHHVERFVLNVPALGIFNREFAATDNNATLSFIIPAETHAGTIPVNVRAIDDIGNKSPLALLNIEAIAGYIATPTFLSPTDGAEVYVGNGELILVSDEFKTVNLTDTHDNSDWKLWKDDAMQELVAEALASSDLLSHTFTGLSLDDGKSYYAGVRHNGASGIKSEFGTIGFVAKNGILSESGRVLYLHESGEVVCVEFDYWGTNKLMQVPIAKYRFITVWSYMEIVVPEINSFTGEGWYLTGSGDDPNADLPAISDVDIRSKMAAFKNDKTGRENCDIWMNYIDQMGSSELKRNVAVNRVRNLDIAGLGVGYFDVPNLYELLVLYAESDNIDMLDYSVAEKPDLALGKSGSYGRFYFPGGTQACAKSSTVRDSQFMWGITPGGYVSACSMKNYHGIVPARVI